MEGDAHDEDLLTRMTWSGITQGDVMQITLNRTEIIGSAVFVLNGTSAERSQMRLFAGASTDYNLNTECNEGVPVTNEGAVNCFMINVDYLQIVYDDSGSSLVIDELFLYEFFDAAQYGTITTNGVANLSRPIIGPIPIGTSN